VSTGRDDKQRAADSTQQVAGSLKQQTTDRQRAEEVDEQRGETGGRTSATGMGIEGLADNPGGG
jgi:hypothetical protein